MPFPQLPPRSQLSQSVQPPQSQPRRTSPLVLLALGCAVLLACNLSSDSNPPTLVPRATSTPPPTMGIATLAPDELPQAAATSVSQQGGNPGAGAGVAGQPGCSLTPLLSRVDPARLMAHVSALQNMYTRHVNSAQNDPVRGVGAAAQYILEEFSDISRESNGALSLFEPQPFTVEWGEQETNQRNLIAVLSGREAGGGIIIIGAHYDSISVATDDGTAYAPGANDNGSGVAALLEMARILSAPGVAERHRSTIMFVAFGAEEINRQGSLAFVDGYLRQTNLDINAMINLDIIGASTSGNGAVDDSNIRLFSAEPNEGNGSESRQLARAINLIADRCYPPMSVQVQPTVDREGRYGDHMSFSDAGYPAVRFIEMLENPNGQHTDADVMSGVRASYLQNATQAVLASVTALADGPRPPQNISLRNDGITDNEGLPLRTLVWERSSDAVAYIIALRAPDSLIYQNYIPPISTNTVQWSGFRAERFVALSISAIDANGLMGPLSPEYAISN